MYIPRAPSNIKLTEYRMVKMCAKTDGFDPDKKLKDCLGVDDLVDVMYKNKYEKVKRKSTMPTTKVDV